MAARIANPESEGEYSDPGDPDYTVVSDGGERAEESEADTLVPGAVQHVRQTGYPSPRRVKKNKAVKKSVDVNEKPNRQKGRKLSQYNPKPTKAQLLAEPITHTLYFKADEEFKRGEQKESNPKILHQIKVQVCTPSGRPLDPKEYVGKIMILDYNKSILSNSFNPSKFDFNPWDREKEGPTISFRLYNRALFQVKKGERLGCAAMIPTAGVPNYTAAERVLEEYPVADRHRQEWPSML